MSFVASSFAVGVVTACAASMHIQFELQYRKELFHLKELMRKEEELDARGYQYMLKERMRDVKAGRESLVVSEAKGLMNQEVVPSVKNTIDSVFKKANEQNAREMFDTVVKKVQEMMK